MIKNSIFGVILDMLKGEVFRDRKVTNSTFMSVLWRASDPGFGNFTGRKMSDILPTNLNAAMRRGNQAGNHICQLTLTIP